MREIKATVPVWFTSDDKGPDTLNQSPERVISEVALYKPHGWDSGDRKMAHWVLIGEADVTFRVIDEATMIENKVSALREEKQRTLAEAQARATEIESKIQKLLAITNEVPA